MDLFNQFSDKKPVAKPVVKTQQKNRENKR